MDENFALFVNEFGEGARKRDVPAASLEYWRGKLPDQWLAYWQDHGWCSYADGLFWTVDPQEFEPVVDAWIGSTPFAEQDIYHIVARSAFGSLYFWGEKTGFSLKIFAPGSFYVPYEPAKLGDDMNREARFFFGSLSRNRNDFANLFSPALQKLGDLDHDEMYGFVPALALGGRSTLKFLQKLKAIEHLMILAQLEELRDVKAVMD